jgi:hypothetical protein
MILFCGFEFPALAVKIMAMQMDIRRLGENDFFSFRIIYSIRQGI